MKQHTLATEYSFCGIGLHSGKNVEMIVCPADVNNGIVFQRTDLGDSVFVEADIRYFDTARRSTALKKGGVKIKTTEHLLSAFNALGIDNALVKLDSPELPILDGSAKPYVEAFLPDGVVEQDAERKYLEVREPVEYSDRKSGSRITILPSDEPSFEVTIDFNSKVLGVQNAVFNNSVDYPSQIAPCRTFCFLKEIKPLLAFGLIKGGTLDNALVIDEPDGYYGNPKLYFDNECARHKLLDLIGDFYLAGAPVRGKVIAYKPGHKINTMAVKALITKVNNG